MVIDQVLKFTDTLIDSIRMVTGELEDLFSDLLGDQGLTLLQSRVLAAIKKADTIAVGQLADSLKLNRANTSNMCKKLEQAGFVKRTRSHSDERIVLVTLTEKGSETLERIDQIILSRYSKVIENTRDEEIEVLKQGMKTVEKLLFQLREANQRYEKETKRNE